MSENKGKLSAEERAAALAALQKLKSKDISEQTSSPVAETPAEAPPSEPAPIPVPEPAPQPMPEPIPEPVPEPMPEPTPEPMPAPAPEPIPEPVPEPTPQPMPEPIQEPVPEPGPEGAPVFEVAEAETEEEDIAAFDGSMAEEGENVPLDQAMLDDKEEMAEEMEAFADEASDEPRISIDMSAVPKVDSPVSADEVLKGALDTAIDTEPAEEPAQEWEEKAQVEVEAPPAKEDSKDKPAETHVEVGMEHRDPSPNCPLCAVSTSKGMKASDSAAFEKAHKEASELWGEWDPIDKSDAWVTRLQERAKDMGIQVNQEMIKEHYSEHRPEQPALGGKIDTELFLEQADSLNARQRSIIDAVYRQGVLLTGQVEEVVCRPVSKSAGAARRAAKSDLKHLASNNFLYRYFASEEDRELNNRPRGFQTSGIWFLGKRSIPYIQRGYGISFQPPYVNYAAEVKKDQLIHDIRANGVMASLAKRIHKDNGIAKSRWGNLQISYDLANWYGPGPLMLSFGFQHGTDWRRVKPDGFATLSLQTSVDVDGKKAPASLMPFWIEYDHGSKDVADVAEQLLAYHFAALAGAPGKRFPDLELEGYAPPVLMVFGVEKQMKAVMKKLQERAQEEGIEHAAPIFVALEKDWSKNPLQENICYDAMKGPDSDPGTFQEMLLRASLPLLRGKALAPGHVLRLDPEGAPYRGTGAGSSASMSERIDMKADEEVKRRNEEVKKTIQGLQDSGAETRSEEMQSDSDAPLDPHDPFADDARAEIIRLQAQLEATQKELNSYRGGAAPAQEEQFFVPGLQPAPEVPQGDANWQGPEIIEESVQEEFVDDPALEEPDPEKLASLVGEEKIETEIEVEGDNIEEKKEEPQGPSYVLEHEKQAPPDRYSESSDSAAFPDLEEVEAEEQAFTSEAPPQEENFVPEPAPEMSPEENFFPEPAPIPDPVSENVDSTEHVPEEAPQPSLETPDEDSPAARRRRRRPQ